jgi:hypothetical protein
MTGARIAQWTFGEWRPVGAEEQPTDPNLRQWGGSVEFAADLLPHVPVNQPVQDWRLNVHTLDEA